MTDEATVTAYRETVRAEHARAFPAHDTCGAWACDVIECACPCHVEYAAPAPAGERVRPRIVVDLDWDGPEAEVQPEVRLYTCDGCGKVDTWNEGWGWYGCYLSLDNGDPVLYTCSGACQKTIEGRKAELLKAKLGDRKPWSGRAWTKTLREIAAEEAGL